MKRKLVALLLASAMTLGAMPAGVVLAAEEAQTEVVIDVDETTPAESITRAQACEMLLTAADDYNNPEATQEQLMEGFEDTDTEKPVTRTEALVMLVRAFGGVPEVKGNNVYLAITQPEFTDVPEWAAPSSSYMSCATS